MTSLCIIFKQKKKLLLQDMLLVAYTHLHNKYLTYLDIIIFKYNKTHNKIYNILVSIL